MKICIDTNIAATHNISMGSVLLLLMTANEVNLEESEKELIKKGLITAERDENFRQVGWRSTRTGNELLDTIILNSDPVQVDNNLSELAQGLKNIFPPGKKEGTRFYWADGIALIIRRLQLFFKKYGNNYSNDQILTAARKYVEGFNGQYKYMRLLKYFILKEERGANGEIEGTSELLNYIENAGQTADLKDDWTSSIN